MVIFQIHLKCTILSIFPLSICLIYLLKSADQHSSKWPYYPRDRGKMATGWPYNPNHRLKENSIYSQNNSSDKKNTGIEITNEEIVS